MITVTNRQPDMQAIPQAIFWRPLKYFSNEIRSEIDDLDEFRFICYAIGNMFNVEIRTYRGHNKQTATLFLSRGGDPSVVADAINETIKQLKLPQTAIAWRRGMKFEHGVLHRPSEDRLREGEARELMLKIAAGTTRYRASMAHIRAEMPRYFELTEKDLQPSKTRHPEPLWHQIVRNVRSHQQSQRGPYSQGLATVEGSTFSLTDAGIAHLKSIGFLS